MKVANTYKRGVSSSKISAILNKSPYKSVIEQFMLDTGRLKDTFTEVSKQKMAMGHLIEPIIKEMVEKTLGVTLVVDKDRYCHDIHTNFVIEFDALDYNTKTIYEFKNTEKDEEHIRETYYPQVQYAMYIIGWENARICYLRNGWELGFIDIPRDENFIKHMEQVAVYYSECLETDCQPDEAYIDNIVSNIVFYQNLDAPMSGQGVQAEMSMTDVQDLYKWADVKAKIEALEAEEKQYKELFNTKWGKYSDGTITYSNAEYVRSGGIDTAKLKIDHPEIDWRLYQKPDTVYQRQTLKMKRRQGEEKVVEKVTEDLV